MEALLLVDRCHRNSRYRPIARPAIGLLNVFTAGGDRPSKADRPTDGKTRTQITFCVLPGGREGRQGGRRRTELVFDIQNTQSNHIENRQGKHMPHENDQAIENLREAGLVPAEQQQPQLARTEDFEEIDALIMGAPPAVKFPEIGTAVSGEINHVFARQATDFDTKEPRFWDDGKPIMEPVIILAGPEGLQTLYCGSQGLRNALREACRDAGVGLRPGGYLAVKYSGDGEPFRKGANPPKIYMAAYDPPGRKRAATGRSELADTAGVSSGEPPF